MTEKQHAFIAEYLVDLDGAAAAVRAGYNASRAKQTAYDLLRRDDVAEAIREAKTARAERVQFTADEVLAELKLLGTSNVNHYVVDDAGHVVLTADAPEGAIRAVSSVKHKVRRYKTKEGEDVTETDVEIRLWDKPAVLRMAGQHASMFVDRQDITSGGKPLSDARADLSTLSPEDLMRLYREKTGT